MAFRDWVKPKSGHLESDDAKLAKWREKTGKLVRQLEKAGLSLSAKKLAGGQLYRLRVAGSEAAVRRHRQLLKHHEEALIVWCRLRDEPEAMPIYFREPSRGRGLPEYAEFGDSF